MEIVETEVTNLPIVSDLKLMWVQDCEDKLKAHWFVVFPAEHPGSPIIDVDFLPGRMSDPRWLVTTLNSVGYEVQGSLWDVEKIKAKAEELYLKTLQELVKDWYKTTGQQIFQLKAKTNETKRSATTGETETS